MEQNIINSCVSCKYLDTTMALLTNPLQYKCTHPTNKIYSIFCHKISTTLCQSYEYKVISGEDIPFSYEEAGIKE